jgi:two-component system cell cycle sensor histidine kinase PleC
MNRRPLVLFGEDLPAAVVALFDASGPAATWLIDVASGRVVAANEKGAGLLDLRGTSPPMFDASMPALMRLRTAATQDLGHPTTNPEPLVFWTRTGAVRVFCRFQLLRTGPRTLAIVTASEAQPSDPSGPEISPMLHAQLAHELKTPLSAIAAASEIMKEERFGPLGSARYRGYASDIFGSAQHMLGVIERMLADGSDREPPIIVGTLAFAEIDAGEVLRSSVSQMMPLAERAGISLSLDLSTRLPHIVADVTSLRQIVFNLLTNAIKFTRRGGSVTAAARYEVDGPFTLTITDTGPGMTQHEIERVSLAAPAPRAEKRRAGAGLGFGLPLVHTLAQANGADLILESTPGRGTSASVVFRKERVIPV